MEKYDENNYEHEYFHGNQDQLDKTNARTALFDMMEDGIISKESKDELFNQIDKGINPLVLTEKTNEYGENIRSILDRKKDA